MITTKADERLVNILKEIGDKTIESIKLKYCQYLISITPLDLAIAEQELFNSGFDINHIESNLPEHIKLLVYPKSEGIEFLPESHIVKKLIAEHHQIDYLLDEIQLLCKQLKTTANLATNPEAQSLIHIARHLNAATYHAEIEERLIYPLLEKEGIEVIPRILRNQISEIITYSSQLFDLAFLAFGNLTETIRKIDETRVKLIPLKRKNLLIEENLLYQIALQILDDETWNKIREQCEKIGFCCFQENHIPRRNNVSY